MRISDWSSDVCSSDLKRRCPLSLCAYPKKRPALRAAFLRAPISSFAGQLFDNCRILQRRDVLCDLLTFADRAQQATRSEEHTSELQSLMRISYAVFCLKKKNTDMPT